MLFVTPGYVVIAEPTVERLTSEWDTVDRIHVVAGTLPVKRSFTSSRLLM